MNKKLDRNYYDILEIERTSDEAAIKKGYRKAALIHHPDKGGSDDMFQQVHEAFQILSDPVKRSEYDKVMSRFDNYICCFVVVGLKEIQFERWPAEDSRGWKNG